MKMYYSQFGEDKILEQIFNKKKAGLCVEVGANDGINDSNTIEAYEKANKKKREVLDLMDKIDYALGVIELTAGKII